MVCVVEYGLDLAAVDTWLPLEALYILTVAFCDIRESRGRDFALRYHSPFDCGHRDRIRI